MLQKPNRKEVDTLTYFLLLSDKGQLQRKMQQSLNLKYVPDKDTISQNTLNYVFRKKQRERQFVIIYICVYCNF